MRSFVCFCVGLLTSFFPQLDDFDQAGACHIGSQKAVLKQVIFSTIHELFLQLPDFFFFFFFFLLRKIILYSLLSACRLCPSKISCQTRFRPPLREMLQRLKKWKLNWWRTPCAACKWFQHCIVLSCSITAFNGAKLM